jgi:hypothetical protein
MNSSMISRSIGQVTSPQPTTTQDNRGVGLIEFVAEDGGLDFLVGGEQEEQHNNRMYPKDLGYRPEHDISALVVRTQAILRDCLALWHDSSSELDAMRTIFGIYPKAGFKSKQAFQVAVAEAGFCNQKVSDDN